MDAMAISPLRNLLFGNGIAGGQDLIALDIQRGRDHGIPDYNTLRVAMGLPAVTSFAQITSNVQIQHELEAAYPGGVNTIDAFEGGVAEDHVPGSDVGPLFQAIMVDQFERLRDGDRFFYLNEGLTSSELKIIQQCNTLAGVIKANTNITNLQADVFLFRASISGTVSTDGSNANGPTRSGSMGMAGLTLELEDDSGDVLATTTTDSQGHYSFNQLSGPAASLELTPGISATGTYRVVLLLPSGRQHTSLSSPLVAIDSGDTNCERSEFRHRFTGQRPDGHSTSGRLGPRPVTSPLHQLRVRAKDRRTFRRKSWKCAAAGGRRRRNRFHHVSPILRRRLAIARTQSFWTLSGSRSTRMAISANVSPSIWRRTSTSR
jgi:hypothetical protein